MTVATVILLVAALGLALSFEFVNGFHDTANAVATVIYTHALPANVAVIWSGSWNFLGVITSSGAVAYGIIALLPVELVVSVGSGAGFAMVFALLLSAIIWNVGTWYLGLPASSSHTLIGSILGVGLMNSWLSADRAFGDGVNWGKVQDTALALLISPVAGFLCAGALLLLLKFFVRVPALYAAPEGKAPPPMMIRGLLILTCTGVSFFHGSNDGQKGMGLIMLILVGVVPAAYAIDLAANGNRLIEIVDSSKAVGAILDRTGKTALPVTEPDVVLSKYLREPTVTDEVLSALAAKNKSLAATITTVKSLSDLPNDKRGVLRTDLFLVNEALSRLSKASASPIPAADKPVVAKYQTQIKSLTQFIPTWVQIAVAIALGLGTTVGWKRIVVTVGEKIGKSHLTYGQGASAELVAMGTIAAADTFGLPVSTTHILSSGIAGTMAANRSGLQAETLRNILLAWVLTLPVCVFLGAGLFGAGLFIVLKLF